MGFISVAAASDFIQEPAMAPAKTPNLCDIIRKYSRSHERSYDAGSIINYNALENYSRFVLVRAVHMVHSCVMCP